MKFTDGNWMMRKGVRAYYPAEAYDVEDHGDSMLVYAPTNRIRHRGDTLQGPLLTVRISSPMADVVRVNITHFSGGQHHGPDFPLSADSSMDVSVLIEDSQAVFRSGKLSARVARGGDWNLEFLADDRLVTRSGSRAMGYAEVEGEGSYLHEQLGLGVGECVYGLGERFTSFVKNGQALDTWNRDGGTGSDQAYKCIPFYLTNRGYGVFVNHPGDVQYEVATEKVSRVQFSVPGQELEYLVIYGPTPKEVLQKYTALTGRPALPPAWTFGLWLTTSFTTSYDEKTVTEFIQGFADRDLPLHVFHFDCFWMREFNWCDLQWDPRTFPDPPAMLSRLKARGLHICTWINPYIAQRSPMFEEGRQGGFLIKKPNGDVWQTDQWQPGMGIVDFTNPGACKWYSDALSRLVDMGVDCFKTDFGERIPVDAVYADGSDPVRMHNFYTYLYNKTVFDLLKSKRGEGEAALFARSATVGGQQFPIHWGGDCYSNFESMAESLRGGLSLCSSGFGFWSHDIGGFEGTPPEAVYKRWVAFGLLSTHSRLHGSSSYRVPWVYGDEAVDTLRFFTKLKCSLMPYLFQEARETASTGVSSMRAMVLEFPCDPACDTLDRQYMLGDSLLVAPVFSEDSVEFYVPEGRWTNFLTNEVVEGPRWVRQSHDFLSVPLLVRPDSVVPVGGVDTRPDYDYASEVTLRVYELADGAETSVTVPTVEGSTAFTAHFSRWGSTISVETDDAPKKWKILLVNRQVESVEGGSAESAPQGTLVVPAGATLTIRLSL